MNLYFRLIYLFLTSPFKSKKNLLDSVSLSGGVMLNDIDINLHVNNGRFLTLADLGRIDFLIRTNFMAVMIKNKWKPIIAGVDSYYLKPLSPFKIYTQTTTLLCWDDKWGYFEHKFKSGNKVVAIIYVKGLFVGPLGRISVEEIAKTLGVTQGSPDMPEFIKRKQNIDQLVYDGLSNDQ